MLSENGDEDDNEKSPERITIKMMIMRKYFELDQWWVGDDVEYYEKHRVSPVTMINADTCGHLW